MNQTNGAGDEQVIQLEGFGPKDLYAKREKIFTRYAGGFFQRLRFYTGWPFLFAYFLIPWLAYDGRPLVLFDLPARQFHILGLTIWPQDLWLLGWLLMIAAFSLFAVTTIVGRLWCGYTCPQTIWTAIYMWMEQVAEGPRHARIRLDQAPWRFDKIRKRAFKHAMWLGFALLTAVTFVGYFTPIRELVTQLATLQAGGWAAFWVLFFTAATYVNAGFMREQVCKYMCPYARFQSAMIDQDTLIVSYDEKRGETRGSRKRSLQAHERPAGLGDCIDCQLCVQVCPTGIDIRDGLQYECIGCAHCIDACAQVMDRMGYAPGLIRYTTLRQLAGGVTRWLRPRSMGYVAVSLGLMAVFTVMLVSRVPFEFDVIRERGQLFHVSSDGQSVRNDYSLKIMNKAQVDAEYQLSVAEQEVQLISETHFVVRAGDAQDVTIQLKRERSGPAMQRVELQLCELATARCVHEETSFLAPGEPV